MIAASNAVDEPRADTGSAPASRTVWPDTPGLPSLRRGDRVHLVGVGGSGMSGLARVLADMGVVVSGSDRQESSATIALRNSGLTIVVGHGRNQVPPGCTLVVRSPAVPDGNPELVAARDAGVPIAKRAQLLGALMDAGTGLAVAGTHGKTTTSGLLAYTLERAGLAPTYFIGGEVLDLGASARHGSGRHVVVEADEYDRSFHHGHPQVAVITSLELDHPDMYRNVDDVVEAFRVFASHVRPGGRIVAHAAYARIVDAVRDARADVTWYDVVDHGHAAGQVRGRADAPATAVETGIGGHPTADWTATIEPAGTAEGDASHQRFHVTYRGDSLGSFELRLPGPHNVANALAVIAVAHGEGVDLDVVRSALRTYRGTARRFQTLGRAMGVRVVDDYAHHPTEIAATIRSARGRFPGDRLWAIVQPHTYSRVGALAEEFRAAIAEADAVVVTPIFAAREAPVAGVSSHRLTAGMPDAWVSPDLDTAAAVVSRDAAPGDTLLFMGAGDITAASRQCLQALRARAADALVAEARQRDLGGSVLQNARLDGFTSLRVGGPADVTVRVTDTADLAGWHALATSLDVPVRVLGRGSNVLASGEGVQGLVIVNRCEAWRVEPADEATAVVIADSGVSLAALGTTLARHGWAGLEAGVGIPGSVGAGVVTNAGAHGWSMADNVIDCRIADASGATVTWTLDSLEMGYRSSALKGRQDVVVLQCRLRVTRDEPEAIAERIAQFTARRRATQPTTPSAGSMFKNPPNDYAGRLIEACDLKGTRIGGAEISPVHANFFVNRGNATSADIEELIRLARARVREAFGIDLELEIEPIGDADVR